MAGTLAHELLDILRCPKCKGSLRFTDGERPILECASCRLRFVVRAGIPIMLIDEAEAF